LACITDFLDGYLARVYAIQSKLGALLDPIADKLLVSAIILILVAKGKVYILPSLAIICREILVSGLREFLATLKVKMPVTRAAKLKTGIQMFALFLLILGDRGSGIEQVNMIGNIFLWLAAILTIATGYVYLRKTIESLGIR
jgi:CDP-diacylglycerol--glycerol-3-phosphate 3-phosphatidyltransferase